VCDLLPPCVRPAPSAVKQNEPPPLEAAIASQKEVCGPLQTCSACLLLATPRPSWRRGFNNSVPVQGAGSHSRSPPALPPGPPAPGRPAAGSGSGGGGGPRATSLLLAPSSLRRVAGRPSVLRAFFVFVCLCLCPAGCGGGAGTSEQEARRCGPYAPIWHSPV
jgi:hypothetical protein